MQYVNDTGLPSVTDILKPWIDTRWYRPEHLKRGEASHDVMACHALGVPYLKQFNPLWQAYIDTGRRWFDKNIKEVILVEKRFVSLEGFTGQQDLAAILKDTRTAIVDWKTSQAEQKYWKFQEAGYWILDWEQRIEIDTRLAVRLRDDYKKGCLVNEYTDSSYDLSKFRDAKNLYMEMIATKKQKKLMLDKDAIAAIKGDYDV